MKIKNIIQFADYSLTKWTAPAELTEARATALLTDASIRKIRIEYEI